MNVVYINLDTSKDRRLYMESQFSTYKINATRFPAIKYEPNTYFINGDLDTSAAEKGCLLSHLHVATAAEEITLVLEDDIDLSLMGQWDFTLEEFVSELPKDWDIVQLFRYPDFFPINLLKKPPLLSGPGGWSCGAYLVHPRHGKNMREMYFKGSLVDAIKLKELRSPIAEFALYNTTNAYTTCIFNVKMMESTIFPGRPENDVSKVAEQSLLHWRGKVVSIRDIF